MRRLAVKHWRPGALGRVLLEPGLAEWLASCNQPLQHGERVLLVKPHGESREATIEHTGGVVTAYLGERQ